MPAVLDRPALPDGFKQGLGTSTQTRDVTTGFVLRLALPAAMAAHSDDGRAVRPLLHHPVRRWHRPPLPGDVAAPFDFPLARAPGDPPAVSEPVSDWRQQALSATNSWALTRLRISCLINEIKFNYD